MKRLKLAELAGLALCTACVAFFCLVILANLHFQGKRPTFPRVLSVTHSEQ